MPQDIAQKRGMQTTEIISIIAGIVLFILATLLLIYTVWAFLYYADVLPQAIASGQIPSSENEFIVTSVYMENCVQYLVFALLLFGVGWLLFSKAIKAAKSTPKVGESTPVVECDQSDRETDTAAATSAPQDSASDDDASKNSGGDDLEQWFEEDKEKEST